jgi:hypothetical protein
MFSTNCYNIKTHKSNAVKNQIQKMMFYLHPHELNLLIHVLTYYIVIVTMTRRFTKQNLNKSASTIWYLHFIIAFNNEIN